MNGCPKCNKSPNLVTLLLMYPSFRPHHLVCRVAMNSIEWQQWRLAAFSWFTFNLGRMSFKNQPLLIDRFEKCFSQLSFTETIKNWIDMKPFLCHLDVFLIQSRWSHCFYWKKTRYSLPLFCTICFFQIASQHYQWAVHVAELVECSLSIHDATNLNPAINSFYHGREPWSSGYGWQLMFEMLWVQIPVPYTGWTLDISSHWFVEKLYCLFEKTENKKKRPRLSHF